MKKKNLKNTSGITVCDSIVMSVKKKHVNFRRIEAIFIALTGYVSTIMVFLCMFDPEYNSAALIASAVFFSVVYIFLSLIGKNAIWLIIFTIGAGGAVLSQKIDEIAQGYKFIFNLIYKASYHTKIEYYKFLDNSLERDSVTAFLIMGAWVLAILIFVFTIYHPHPIPTLIAVFPIIEIGMYNGLEVNIFWGMMVIAYLIAVFAMNTIDMGEYSGGNGGFVRKENLFFPKRQMRLKVTEKCGVYLILFIMVVTGITAGAIKLTGYKRSEELNQKRIAIRDAITSFSFENFADSVSDLTVAFGFTFKVETHKLGNIASMKYKDRTDMTVTFDNNINGAIYLKEFTGSVYKDNEWSPLPENKYNSPIFSDFDNYGIYPQDFPYKFNSLIYYNNNPDYTIWINSSLKGERSFAPYGTDSIGGLEYNHDTDVTSKVRGKKEFSYKFSPVDAESVMHMLGTPVRNVYTIDNIAESEHKDKLLEYITDKGSSDYSNYISIDSELPVNMDIIYNQPELIMAELLRNDYRSFVYDNYLQVPDDTNMEEIREEFSDALERSANAVTAVEKINILYELRGKVAEMAEYSLNPGKTPNSRDFVNYFLFENHKGYCTHYATTGVILARMAGIPARYATGYVIVGDDFSKENSNNDGSYTIDVKDNRSHAWIEVYLDGYGWVPFEFTAGFTSQSIDTTPTTAATEPSADDTVTTTAEEVSSETDTTANERPDQTSTHATNDRSDSTTAVTSGGGIPIGTSPDGGKHMSASAKYAIYTVLSIIAIVLFVILRRELIHYIRYKRFTEGKISKRAGHMYTYTERLLASVRIHRDEKGYSDFADHVENRCGGRYFAKGGFAEFVDTSLCAAFSDDPPEEEKMKKCFIFTQDTAETIYKSKGIFGKFYMKYISCLI